MHKWQRQGWLSEIDLRRILCCLQNMRMLCNSTFLSDNRTRHSPKLDEFREIIRELTLEKNRKVVVFTVRSPGGEISRRRARRIAQIQQMEISAEGLFRHLRRSSPSDRNRKLATGRISPGQ
jgi:hypothetical protein